MKPCLRHVWLLGIFFWPTVVLAAEPDWSAYAALLQRHVTPKTINNTPLHSVNYSQVKSDPLFAQTLATIANHPESALATPAEKLAFYINAYNILAIKVVVDHWPLQSIKEGGGFITPVWKMEAGTVGGKGVSLDHVEHKILRPMGEPRIHLALARATVSCPDLRREPYTAAQLTQQLEDQTRSFFNNPVKGLLLDGPVAHISRIFDWSGQDFQAEGGVEAFVHKYHPLPEKTDFDSDLPYNWSLNGR